MSENALATGASRSSRLPARAARRFYDWTGRRPWQGLSLVLLLALLLGIAKLRLDPPSEAFNWENRWWQIALNVERGQGYAACKPIYFPFCGPDNQATAMREPLPVLLYAGIARLSGESLPAAAFSGVLVNLGVILAVFQLARQLAGPRAGLLAALIWALYLAPVRYDYSQVSGDLPAALCLTAALAACLRARETGGDRAWLAAGALLGLAVLSRSAVLVAALALPAAIALWPGPGAGIKLSLAGRARPAALFALAWILVVSPWFVRNLLVFGRPVVGSTLSGYYLLRQHYPLPTGDYLRFVSGGEFTPVLQKMLAQDPSLRGDENEAEMDAFYRAKAVEVIRRYPGRYARLSLHRFGMLWFNRGVNEVYGKPNAPGDLLIQVQHALLLVGGLSGLAASWRRAWPLAATLVVFSLACMGVMAHILYIVPVVPLLAALTALALARGARAARRRFPILTFP